VRKKPTGGTTEGGRVVSRYRKKGGEESRWGAFQSTKRESGQRKGLPSSHDRKNKFGVRASGGSQREDKGQNWGSKTDGKTSTAAM